MAENNENTSRTPSEGNEAGSAERKRRRGHRGGRNHKHHREGAPVPVEAGAQAPAQNAPAESKGEGKKKKNNDRRGEQGNAQKRERSAEGQGQDAQKGERHEGGRNRHGRGNKKNGGGFRPDHVSHKDDIYGDPKEEKELAEWRAKIVLNADPAPKQSLAPEKEAPVEEPVEISEDIDLFESPILAPVKDDAEKVEVIGVRFRSAGKTYYFDPKDEKVAQGSFAIVETARGPEFGEVCLANSMVKVSETVTPLRPLIRIATEADIAHNEENRKKEKDALGICAKKIAEHELDMKLIDAQYAFDNSKLLFYFSSEGRVDFRELVKDLASVFRTRIELRQIGIRDEAKMLGGFGACGRLLCCSTFLPDFSQVSIKMAKEQGLSLNATKISGMCGKLMCCLRFESEVYSEEIKRTPAQGSTVKTEDGVGTVISVNPLAGTVRVLLKDTPDAPPKQYHRDTLTVLPKEKPRTEGSTKGDKADKASTGEGEGK